MCRASFFFREAGAPMKFFQLFSKPGTLPVSHVRQASSPSPSPSPSSAALETARKIDAIESEIRAELDACAPATELADPSAVLAQRIDEASLLHASRQPEAATALLLEAVAQRNGSDRELLAWTMLLELSIAAGSQPQFEELALRYAQRFETSPPQWRSAPPASAAAPPVLAYRGKLASSAAPALARFGQLAQAHAAFRLDLDGVTEVDAAGCSLLLDLFGRWLAEQRRIELLPASALATLLRAQLDAAPADADDSRWRLLIELLRSSGDVDAHDEACIAYSVAHEVSPPAPLLPLAPEAAGPADSLALPAEISVPVDALLESLRAQAAQQSCIVLDCSRLQLVEFSAAAPLLAGIARLADGKPVEWRDMSHLVSTLLQLIGGAGRLRIINRKP